MEDSSSFIISIILFCVILVVNFIFYGFRSAVNNFFAVDLDEIEDEQMRSKIDRVLGRDMEIRRTYRTVTSLGWMIAGMLFLWQFAPRIAALLPYDSNPHYLLWECLILILGVILICALGVSVPIKVGERKAAVWLCRYVGFINFMVALARPLVCLINGIANLIVPLFRVDPHQSVDDITEDEIISMIDESNEQGMILESEAELIHNIFELNDKDAGDIMTQRTGIFAIDGDLLFRDAYEVMIRENYSRFPVYSGDIDHFIGVIHIKDAMRLHEHREYDARPIRRVPGLLRELAVVPEGVKIHQLLNSMKNSKAHMVAVVDEYGQTAGIVAMEDILEELVGEIEDEHDVDISMIVRQRNDRFLLNGMAPLDEVSKALGIDCEMEDINTLNGFLINLIDRIPADDEIFEVDYGGYRFRVLSVVNKTIKTVMVRKLPQEEINIAVDQKDRPADKEMKSEE